MFTNRARAIAIVTASMTLLACSEAATEPRHGDIDLARTAWLGNHPHADSFEVAIETSMLPRSGYYRVQVFGWSGHRGNRPFWEGRDDLRIDPRHPMGPDPQRAIARRVELGSLQRPRRSCIR